MDPLDFATVAAFGVFVAWELLCYTQLKITKIRNKRLHKRIHGE